MLENSMVRHDVRPWEWDKWDDDWDDDNSNVCGYDDDEDEEEDW